MDMANNFEYYSPTRVIFGKGTEQKTGRLAMEYGASHVFIITPVIVPVCGEEHGYR